VECPIEEHIKQLISEEIMNNSEKTEIERLRNVVPNMYYIEKDYKYYCGLVCNSGLSFGVKSTLLCMIYLADSQYKLACRANNMAYERNRQVLESYTHVGHNITDSCGNAYSDSVNRERRLIELGESNSAYYRSMFNKEYVLQYVALACEPSSHAKNSDTPKTEQTSEGECVDSFGDQVKPGCHVISREELLCELADLPVEALDSIYAATISARDSVGAFLKTMVEAGINTNERRAEIGEFDGFVGKLHEVLNKKKEGSND
jgi:hypothetical protein